MKNISLVLLVFLPVLAFCQQDTTKTAATKPPPKPPHHSLGIGIKAGLNFTNVTGASDVSNSSETGYQVGLFLDPSSASILGSRTELVYSHQGYNYATGQTTGKVFLNYIMLAQLMRINITHFFQIQLGTQIAYLINAKVDSTSSYGGILPPQEAQILNYYNRIDFGFSGGVEVRPFMGILVGVRYNMSLTNLYKIPDMSSGQTPPSFFPTTSDINFKNNLLQIYVGYRF
jgi:Outer membrane protein beta-barrel domain